MSIHHASKTHCANGHPLTEDNIKNLSNGSGHRVCKTCHRENARKYREARKRPRISAKDRFLKYVVKSDACWHWIGSKCGGKNSDYGAFRFSGKQSYAHRFAYELKHGIIPTGFQIDHLCRNRSCVNPDHLEAVSQRENLLRGEGFASQNSKKTHCKHGHEFTTENTYFTSSGRGCIHCRDLRNNCKKARNHLI